MQEKEVLIEQDQGFDIIDQLKHVCVKIPLLQEIKDVPIYSKALREACLKKIGKKKKDLQIVHVMGQLPDIMLGKVVIPKYSDPGSPVVSIVINGSHIRNVLIDLGVAINVMTREVMKQLEINSLRPTSIVL